VNSEVGIYESVDFINGENLIVILVVASISEESAASIFRVAWRPQPNLYTDMPLLMLISLLSQVKN
jgi:hypothetical protein